MYVMFMPCCIETKYFSISNLNLQNNKSPVKRVSYKTSRNELGSCRRFENLEALKPVNNNSLAFLCEEFFS